MKDLLITDNELEILYKLTDSETKAYKNWIATAVEGGKFDYAQKLTRELRAHQDLAAKLNGERRVRGLGEWANKADA